MLPAVVVTPFMPRTDAVSGAAGIDRRTVLRAAGAGLVAPAFAGVAAAKPGKDEGKGRGRGKGEGAFPPAGLTEWGESVAVGDGEMKAFATVMPQGDPVYLGVWMDASVFDDLPEGESYPPQAYHLHFPDVTGTNFTYAGVDWNPAGHPPTFLYAAPHFDVHFYLMEEDDVEDIPGGVATYDLPDDQLPENNAFASSLGAPREIVPGMGEHLADLSAPELNGEEFTHTLIWGAYDPALLTTEGGDGVGELTFVEPMVTKAYLQSDELVESSGVTVEMNVPEAFPEAGHYPTTYTMQYLSGPDAYVVYLGDFESFPASDGVVSD
jgi:hypothetical protein